MNTLETIKSRRSIRKFKETKVPHDVIEKDDIIVVVGSNEGMKRWEKLK